MFIIKPHEEIEPLLVYPMTTDRNFDEVLRVVNRFSSPRSTRWPRPELKEGEDVMIAGSVSDEEAKKTYPDVEGSKPYIQIVPHPTSP